MSIAKSVAEFSAALDTARAELAEVVGKISKLEAERLQIECAQPHTDDIVAVFLAGLDGVEQSFESQFRAVMSSDFTLASRQGDMKAPARAARPGTRRYPLALALPESERGRDVISNNGFVQLNVTAVTYFLRHAIADQIPGLVERLCPGASKGIKASERAAALADIDIKLTDLKTQRDALQIDLNAARQAANR